jgi:hypothetical protein
LRDKAKLDFAVMEHLVLFRTAAMRALEAANEKHCNAHRNQDGKNTSVYREPMSKMLHLRSTPGIPAQLGSTRTEHSIQEHNPEYLF